MNRKVLTPNDPVIRIDSIEDIRVSFISATSLNDIDFDNNENLRFIGKWNNGMVFQTLLPERTFSSLIKPNTVNTKYIDFEPNGLKYSGLYEFSIIDLSEVPLDFQIEVLYSTERE